MAEAVSVSIPAGVNPSAVGGNGADVTHYGSRPAAGTPAGDSGIPPLPAGTEQKPGFQTQQAPTPPAGVDPAEYAAFLAFKAAQAGTPAPTQPVKPALPTPVAKAESESIGAQAAFDAAMQAGATDPVIGNTFEMISMVAPNVDLVRALGNAIDRGDIGLIDRAYLKEVGGDKADKIIKLAEGMVQHVEQQADAVIADTYKAAGGEAEWNAASAAFSTSAPDYLKQYVVDALNSANPTKIRVGVAAVLEYVKKTGALPQAPQGHVRAGGGLPNESMGLSKQAYQAERLKLNRFDRDYNDRARELDARRAIGKKAGL